MNKQERRKCGHREKEYWDIIHIQLALGYLPAKFENKLTKTDGLNELNKIMRALRLLEDTLE